MAKLLVQVCIKQRKNLLSNNAATLASSAKLLLALSKPVIFTVVHVEFVKCSREERVRYLSCTCRVFRWVGYDSRSLHSTVGLH